MTQKKRVYKHLDANTAQRAAAGFSATQDVSPGAANATPHLQR